MDHRTVEINSLRLLNDYLNQTIDLLVQGQRATAGAVGYPHTLNHSPFNAGIGSMLSGFAPAIGAPSYAASAPFASPFAGVPVNSLYPTAIDPFGRGLAHTPFAANAWQQSPWQQSPWQQSPWSAAAEVARHQLGAILARQQIEALQRGYGGI